MQCIYRFTIVDKNNQKRYYIGQTVNLHKRIKSHINHFKDPKVHTKLKNFYLKYGFTGDWCHILEEVQNKEDLTTKEQFWIDCYLITFGADMLLNTSFVAKSPMLDPSIINKRWSQERRAALKEQIIERNKKPKSAYTKNRISESQKKLWNSERKQQFSFTSKARWTQERRAAKSLSNRIKNPMHDRDIAKRHTDLISKEFDLHTPEGKHLHGKNIALFCRENNLDHACILKVLKKVRKHHKGWTSCNCASVNPSVADVLSIIERHI